MKVVDPGGYCLVAGRLIIIVALVVIDVPRAVADDSSIAVHQADQTSQAPAHQAVAGAILPGSLNYDTAGSFAETSQPEPEESGQLQRRRIGDIRPSFDYAWGDVDESDLPQDFSTHPDDQPTRRVVQTQSLLQWQPSNSWYHPLYFEDPALERYGHTYSPFVQPLVSTGRFIGQTVTLPYHAALRPMQSREYPLGWYRPGEFVPYLNYRPAWNREAAGHQALAITGLIFLIP